MMRNLVRHVIEQLVRVNPRSRLIDVLARWA